MKMYEILDLNNLYDAIKDQKMPIKTVYKFSLMMKKAQSSIEFYQAEFSKILEQYAQKKDGEYVYLEDGGAIAIIPGKEQECANKITELRGLDVEDILIEFNLEELEDLELTIEQMNVLLPFIKE